MYGISWAKPSCFRDGLAKPLAMADGAPARRRRLRILSPFRAGASRRDDGSDGGWRTGRRLDRALAITATLVLAFSWIVTVSSLAHKERYVLAFLMTLLTVILPVLFRIWLRDREAAGED